MLKSVAAVLEASGGYTKYYIDDLWYKGQEGQNHCNGISVLNN